MATSYKTKLEELKLEKNYTRHHIEMERAWSYLIGAVCILAGFIIGYLIK